MGNHTRHRTRSAPISTNLRNRRRIFGLMPTARRSTSTGSTLRRTDVVTNVPNGTRKPGFAHGITASNRAGHPAAVIGSSRRRILSSTGHRRRNVFKPDPPWKQHESIARKLITSRKKPSSADCIRTIRSFPPWKSGMCSGTVFFWHYSNQLKRSTTKNES